MRRMPHLATLLLRGVLVAAGLTAPAHAADRPVPVRPATLPAGPPLAFPHVVDTTLVDGAVRIALDGDFPALLGKVGQEYVVWIPGSEGPSQVRRYRADGSHRVLVSGPGASEVRLSDDGAHLVSSRYTYRVRTTTLDVRDAASGVVLDRERFTGYVGLVDALGSRLLITRDRPARTSVLNWRTGRERVLRRQSASFGDLSTRLFATYTKDPYQGGCTVLARLARPRTTLWRSCTQRVAEIAPSGRRMLTIDLLSDGLGPSQVALRRVGGTLLQRYRTRPAFGEMAFEPDGALALEVIDTDADTVGWARCRLATCERPTS